MISRTVDRSRVDSRSCESCRILINFVRFLMRFSKEILMTLRTGHGTGAGVPRIEVLPPDELPKGLQVHLQAEGTTERTASGRFSKGASTTQRKGGLARRGKTRLAAQLGLAEDVADPAFEPYQRAAEDFKRAHILSLAQSVGGGYVGPGPASIVASAALQLAASRWAFDHGDHETGSKLANDSRQNLLAAHELVAREAKARPQEDAFDRLRREAREAEDAYQAEKTARARTVAAEPTAEAGR